MKGLLLRVGIDRGFGGCLAPIFDDGSFEYIPIPERCATSENRMYADLPGRNCRTLADFVPANLHNSAPHFDPEFETFTYGDPTRNKRKQLLKLDSGDLLIFYAGLEPGNGIDIPRLFIIGYFTVKQVYDFNKIARSERGSVVQKIRNNAHAKRKSIDEGLVVVEGDPQESRLLPKAIPLGDSRNHVMLDLARILGYKGSVLRAIGHWIDEEHIQRVKKWLDSGVPVLVEENSHLFSYVLASDTGFAPNITGGYCTLACCKPKIRGAARIGDWLVGTLPNRLGRDRLGYIMRINEILSFDDYFRDDRFGDKKPSDDHPNGDNIYYRIEGRFIQLKNRHHSEEHLDHDTQADRVLISSLFWYFGDRSPRIPPRFISSVIKKGPGHKRVKNTKTVKEFVSWVGSEYRPGILGRPRDGYSDRGSER